MTELFEQLIEQQAEILRKLEAIEGKISEIADNADEYAPASTASSIVAKLTDIANSLEWTDKASTAGQILNEISWTSDNSTADRLIGAIESLEAAIRELRQ